MIKVKKRELRNILNKFNNCSIKIVFNCVLNGGIIVNNCICKYTNRSGNIEIKDNDTKDIFTIDTFLVYKILRDNNFTILELYMDYDLKIRILKV